MGPSAQLLLDGAELLDGVDVVLKGVETRHHVAIAVVVVPGEQATCLPSGPSGQIELIA